MDTVNEVSSSLTFASSYLSNGSSNENMSTSNDPGLSIENLSLSKLSGNLEKLLIDPEYDYSDAEIVVEGISVPVHKCILASRSQFFHEIFKKGNDSFAKEEGKPRYVMSELVANGVVGYEAFNVFLHYLYMGKLKPSPPEVSTCIDEACAHDACRPAINYAVELMYASATFQMKELILLVQRRLLNFVEKALVEDVIPILWVAFHFQLNQLLFYCIQRLTRSHLDSVSLEKELPYEISKEIRLLRVKSQQEDECNVMEVDCMNERNIKRIHKALDSDDVELVKLFLNESDVTLDDAFALHYASAYCDPKVVKDVLSLGLADINLRNSQRYTVIHVAARRKEPSVLVALLNKGACVSDTTLDGETAVAICRRLTRPKDYNEKTVQGKESNKDRICIDLLEREMRRNTLSVNISNSSELSSEELPKRLYYLENRVAFARVLFPAEARLAMENADADSALLYSGPSTRKGSSGNLRGVNLNETPSVQAKGLMSRLNALLKTVEMGRRYFPHYSELIDTILEDDMPDVFFLEKGSEEEQRAKKLRFKELKEDVQKAFHKDMNEKNW